VHNPKLVKASAPLGAYFHPGGYSLSEREREIAVIIINSKWHSAYPTNAHERRGKEVGLPAEKVEAMLSGLPTSFRGRARADCLRNRDLSQQFALGIEGSLRPRGQGARPCRHHRRDHLNGLLHQLGYYTSVSMSLAFYDVPQGAPGIVR
jgi:4-carboxymuconolactone decarboxylase